VDEVGRSSQSLLLLLLLLLLLEYLRFKGLYLLFDEFFFLTYRVYHAFQPRVQFLLFCIWKVPNSNPEASYGDRFFVVFLCLVLSI
jgi:hypothetical protein